jgi:hypothetical protein
LGPLDRVGVRAKKRKVFQEQRGHRSCMTEVIPGLDHSAPSGGTENSSGLCGSSLTVRTAFPEDLPEPADGNVSKLVTLLHPAPRAWAGW